MRSLPSCVAALAVALALLASACREGASSPTGASPPAPPPVTVPALDAALDAAALRAEALAGKLPSEPERELTRAHCGMCHDEQYLVQQRITPEQWHKTIGKMKIFGAPVPHADGARIAEYLARSFPPDLPSPPATWGRKPE